MAGQQKLDLALTGLYTSPNNLSGVPQGAMEIANNVVINAKNRIDSRRGQTQYLAPLSIGSGQINKIFNYASNLIVNYDNKMAYESGGAWVNFSGTYNAPANGYKMRSLEALKNFYFTTDKGIYKIDALGASPREAGVARALGGTGIVTGATGFLQNDSAVAYRVVWGYRDENNNLLLGAPSQRIVVSNSSGSTKDVELTFSIPDSITTEYFYQVYRSFGSATATTEPSDELQLVIEANPTSGEITAKEIIVVDQTPYSLMRATLYTSPSQEGIENANLQPPYAKDMDIFKGCAFYANVKQKQSLSVAMISVDSPSLGYLTDATVDTTTGSPILTGITSTADLRVGMRAVGSGIQANARILTIDSATQVTLTSNATATATVSVEFQDRFSINSINFWAGSTQDVATNTFLVDNSGTPAQNINATAINLLEIINTSPSNTIVYGYYTSSVEDLPGQMQFEERAIGGAAFSLTSTAGTSFSPELPASGTSVSSNNDERQNRVYISKSGQVEAVPVYSYFDIGSANFPIERVVALRDGIFFFKTDGIFRLSGEVFSNFTTNLVDNTVILRVPESAVPFNNQVFCFTTQGICAVTDGGVQILSVPIENTLLELSSEQYTNFAAASFGVAYESARQYLFFTVTQEDDTFATQAFVYNALTNTWTRWVMNRVCGVVSSAVNKLFMGEPDTGQILIERKTYTNQDFADEQYSVTITSVVSDTEVVLSSVTNVEVGMTLSQAGRLALIEAINGTTLTISERKGLMAGAALVYTPIDNLVQWAPIDADNAGILKQFSELSLFFRNAAFREIDATFATNVSLSGETVMIANMSANGWGQQTWGSFAWGGAPGGQNVLRTYVPREKQRAHWVILSLRTREAFTGFSLQGVSIVFNPMSTRFK